MHQNKKILYFCLCYIGIDLSKTTFWVNISTRPFFFTKKWREGKDFSKYHILEEKIKHRQQESIVHSNKFRIQTLTSSIARVCSSFIKTI